MVHRWSTSFEIERTTSGGACSQDLVLSRRRRRPAQLANDVTVRVEGHVGGVSQLFGELRDRRALANPQGGERLLRAQARVGQNGDESGVASSIAPDERLTNGLDLNG